MRWLMSTVAVLFLAGVLFAHPRPNVRKVATDPNGEACTSSSDELIYDGDRYTCTALTYSVVAGGGASAFDDLSDVTITAPATGATLIKSAGDWIDGALDLADSDAVTGNLPDGNIPNNITIDLAATATALAANGANCAAGEIARGVDASGAVEDCYEPAEADISDLAHTATAITDGLIVEFDLDEDSGTPIDEDVLTFDSTGNNFNWIAQSAIAAGTAAALAADPSDCAANQFADTIAASGNLSCSAIADADVPNNITIDLATVATTATTANAGDSATAFFSGGTIEHERGGLEADVSGYTDGLYGMAAGVTTDIDTLAELNTAISSGLVTGAHTVEVNDLSAAVTWTNIPDANVPDDITLALESASLTNVVDDKVLVGTGAATAAYILIPDCDDEANTLAYDQTTNAFSCNADAGSGGGMTSWTAQADDTNTMTIGDGDTVDLAGGLGLTTTAATGTPEQWSTDIDYSLTLAGNAALGAKECVFASEGTSGGGFLCEGSTGSNSNEQLYLFPAVDGADTTSFVAVDATQVTDLEGTGLSITAGTLNSHVATVDEFCTDDACTVGTDDTITIEGGTTITAIDATEIMIGAAGGGAAAFAPLSGDATMTDAGVVSVVDLTCTDCINATEIEDIYALLAGDTFSGTVQGTSWSITDAGAAEFASVTVDPSSTPELAFLDLEAAAGGDDNARIYANCTDVGDGSEDCDITIAQQEAGAEKVVLAADADAGITLGSANNNSLTVTTDSTGDGEVVLPNDSIGQAEIDFATVTCVDLTMSDCGAISSSGTVAATTVTGANVTSGADPGHTHTAYQATDAELTTLAGLTEVQGSIIIGDATPAWSALGIGAANAVLLSNATTAAWDATPAIDGSDFTSVDAATGDSATAFFDTGAVEVSYGGTGASTLTDGGILLGSGTGAITALGVATNGQIPIGDGTTDPQLGTLTATANETEITNGAGSITVGIVTSPTLDGTNFSGIPAGAYTANEIDGDDINSNIAGRSLTLTAASPDTLDADVELYTDTSCIYLEDPTADDDLQSIWTPNGFAVTITKIWCESDQTVNADLQIDDGSPADVAGTDLVCDSTPAEDESGLTGSMADGDRLDLAVTSVSGTPTWVSICWTYTKDD